MTLGCGWQGQTSSKKLHSLMTSTWTLRCQRTQFPWCSYALLWGLIPTLGAMLVSRAPSNP